jgi:hypothetical protein
VVSLASVRCSVWAHSGPREVGRSFAADAAAPRRACVSSHPVNSKLTQTPGKSKKPASPKGFLPFIGKIRLILLRGSATGGAHKLEYGIWQFAQCTDHPFGPKFVNRGLCITVIDGNDRNSGRTGGGDIGPGIPNHHCVGMPMTWACAVLASNVIASTSRSFFMARHPSPATSCCTERYRGRPVRGLKQHPH